MATKEKTHHMFVDEDEERKIVVSNDQKKGLQAYKYAFDKHTRLHFQGHLTLLEPSRIGRSDKLSDREKARSMGGNKMEKGPTKRERNGQEARSEPRRVNGLAELSQLKVNYLSAKTTEFQSADE